MRSFIVSLGLVSGLGFMSSALVSSALATSALADETLPTRKPGLWETKMINTEGNATARQCIDEKTDQIAQSAMGGAQTCTKRSVVKTATGYESEAECKIGPISASSKGTFTGDFSSKIHVETDTVLSGLPTSKEPVKRHMVLDASFIGPCQAGQSPGDMIMPDGKIVKMPKLPH